MYNRKVILVGWRKALQARSIMNFFLIKNDNTINLKLCNN